MILVELSVSCNYLLVASKCVQHIRTLSASVDNVLNMAPLVAEDPRMENNSYVQDTFGVYCRYEKVLNFNFN